MLNKKNPIDEVHATIQFHVSKVYYLLLSFAVYQLLQHIGKEEEEEEEEWYMNDIWWSLLVAR